MDDVILNIALPYVVGVIYTALGVPLALGRVAPNGWYGVRIPKTMENQDVWYSVNRTCGRAMIACGGLSLVIAFLLHVVWGTESAAMLMVPIVVQILLIVVSIVVTLRST